ncbi:GNAT family N-acetyltransferase [Actinotalea sp. K2]|uniref:GNAT family N-acetyltransferase n=1 Tax=Actinotalea sp. K2 TaxID=2939438 RepID=UPI0020180D4F|nr:GNAT family N-acetyltransferase [Actinotalea sp. K2]MCL3863150.1 GNAT family N-acetyltransferase [Actinotalea sp. K2]
MSDPGVTTPVIEVLTVPWDDERAARLRDEQQAELAARYDGVEDIEPDLPVEQMLATVVVSVDGEVAGCGALRAADGYRDGVGELKRMFVRPPFRGRGLSRLVLAELERRAVEQGLRRLLLETGVRQPEAIGLYRSAGYRRIPNYGPYVEEADSVCYARWLDGTGTRVVVVNGTMGAGKTTVASAMSDLLREREVPHGWVDVDALCQVWPTSEQDPYAQSLVFLGLAGLAPGLAAQGYRRVVLARVVEDPADRERYEMAFDGADVTVVRLRAAEHVRVERLTAREPEGYWQDLAFARTVELEAVLTALDLDDAVVDNDGRPAREVAGQVLGLLGW